MLRRFMFGALGLMMGLVIAATSCGTLAAQEAATEAKKEEKKSEGKPLKLGALTMMAPGDWEQKQPRSRMLSYEFSAPAKAKKDDPTARITIMQAGGSIEANIKRWIGQFSQPDGKATKEVAKVEEFEVDGTKVHWVDISGTFAESMGGGPFAPGKIVKREGHRMIGVIVVPKESRAQYFIKMTGKKDLVEKLAKDFQKSLKELK